MTGGLDLPRLRDQLAEDLAEDLDNERRPAVVADDLPADRHLDRENSWLQFNARVLALAEDESLPLLERVRFLAIFAGNLDEYFMVRVAGLQRRVEASMGAAAPGGRRTPAQHLALIAERVHTLAPRHASAFAAVRHQLAAAGVAIVRWGDLTADERAAMDREFAERLYPILTPLAVDPAHPFPYISSLSLNLAVLVRDDTMDTEHFARVKVPGGFARFLPLGAERFVPLEDVIREHLPELFPGMRVLEASTFRVTRNQDVVLDEDETENLLAALERELQRRRFGPPVRLELEDTTSEHVRELLVRELDVEEESVYTVAGPLDLRGLFALADIDRPDLKYPTFIAATPERLLDEDGAVGDFFATLRGGDLLVHHPYDSFRTTVQAFVAQAAVDPNVLAIKATLYRTSGDSPIVEALITAAEAGKQVLVVVEITARFDEEANIQWARTLERAGCHVVYGMVGLKTHSKLCLVVRRETDGSLRRYAHIGTGNYNPKTARIYEDAGLFTAADDVGDDLTQLFNHLSGYTRPTGFATLLVAPETLRPTLVTMIEREMEHARRGRPSAITMKMNSLVDEEIVDALYRASRAGVPVSLIVRGICTLRPGVPGLSENINVRSILGRFLEHSRIFRFEGGGEPVHLIGSADMMHRNLDRRVEAVVRVRDGAARERLNRVLDLSLDPRIAAWDLDSGGEWTRRVEAAGAPLMDLQTELIATTRRTAAGPGRAHERDRSEVPRAPAVRSARPGRRWFPGRQRRGV